MHTCQLNLLHLNKLMLVRVSKKWSEITDVNKKMYNTQIVLISNVMCRIFSILSVFYHRLLTFPKTTNNQTFSIKNGFVIFD